MSPTLFCKYHNSPTPTRYRHRFSIRASIHLRRCSIFRPHLTSPFDSRDSDTSTGNFGYFFCFSLWYVSSLTAHTLAWETDRKMIASSFPTLSKHVSFLHIPRIVFFIGKHVGTGERRFPSLHAYNDIVSLLRSQVSYWQRGSLISCRTLLRHLETTSSSNDGRLGTTPV